MIDIHAIIAETVRRTGQPEAICEKVVRSMFHDVQEFTSKKKGVNIQIPQVGTFVFRAAAIPNYTNRTKSTLAYWINRLMVGEVKSLDKTISAAKNNIAHCFYNLERVSEIKEQFINEHSKYKPRTKTYLVEDHHSHPESIRDYIATIKTQLFYEENDYPSPEDLP
jgi:hypothetical protein